MFKKQPIKKLLALLTVVGLMFSLAGCGGGSGSGGAQADARDYYKVGVITSLSGAEVLGGNLTKRGYSLWEETVNAKGGINGNRIVLVEEDERGKVHAIRPARPPDRSHLGCGRLQAGRLRYTGFPNYG